MRILLDSEHMVYFREELKKMVEASWVEDPGESTPLSPFPRSEEQERRRKRDVEGCTSEPPLKRLSKTDIVDDDPKTSEPPRRLSTKGHASVES